MICQKCQGKGLVPVAPGRSDHWYECDQCRTYISAQWRWDYAYQQARYEHALMLRCEGLTYERMSKHLGTRNREGARQLLQKGIRNLRRGMKHTRFRWLNND